MLLDAIPLTLGIETAGGLMTAVVPRNTQIPAKKTHILSTESNNQAEIVISILEGENQMAEDNTILGKLKLEGISPAPKDVP